MKTVNLSTRRLKLKFKTFFEQKGIRTPRLFFYKFKDQIRMLDLKQESHVIINITDKDNIDFEMEMYIGLLGYSYPRYEKPLRKEVTYNISPSNECKPRTRKKNKAYNRYSSSQAQAEYKVITLRKAEQEKEIIRNRFGNNLSDAAVATIYQYLEQ